LGKDRRLRANLQNTTMMKTILFSAIAAFSIATAHAAPEVGKAAPDFSATGAKGEKVTLADLKGKIVVLEWTNPGCPFVGKHYSGKNMQKLQTEAASKGVVWITIDSASDVGDAKTMADGIEAKGGKPAHVIADGKGTIGKAFDAKVTPHMFIIDKEGMLKYDGAMDSKATTEVADLETADKYFADALVAVIAGKDVKHAKNKPYGCGVKY
jgi:peroxiredoxin